MVSYKVVWKSSATKELRKLPSNVIIRILDTVDKFSEDPFPSGIRKLHGSNHTYRARIGDYRIIYSVRTSILIVEIVRVGHRKNIYR